MPKSLIAVLLAVSLAPLAANGGTPIPMSAASAADSGSAASADAGSAATGAPRSLSYLGFPSKASFHAATGWASGGLLLAAGAVGAVRALSLQQAGHSQRGDVDDEDEIDAACAAIIRNEWADDQWLRWTHVGFLIAGEGLYLADAITGIDFMKKLPPGLSRAKLHRWAFFVHGGLMLAEAVLGFMTTDALARGDHEAVADLGQLHAAVGFAIPAAIFASGAIQVIPLPFKE